MGGPAKSGYCGGKFWPSEKDLIKGIVAAKSLQTLVAISRFPNWFILKVFHISHQEKTKRIAKNKNSTFLFLLMISEACHKLRLLLAIILATFKSISVYQTIEATGPEEVIR